jgi:tetratricopeptide (TPR) repeat protein
MNKTEFLALIQQFPSATQEQAQAVLNLEKRYPYSQLLHALGARLSQEHQLPTQQAELQLAAVYAADRHVLKERMIKSSSNTITKKVELNVGDIQPQHDGLDYADLVLKDLKLLSKSKHTFEMLFDEFIHQQNIRKDDKKKTNQKQKQAATQLKTSAAKEKTKQKHTLKTPVKKVNLKPKRKGLSGEELISEIETTHRKLKPKSNRQQQQIAMIEKFIKKQPSISPPKPKANPSGNTDLSGVKQGEFDQHIISETLVKILIGQGKKEKAIELLKKLIWKFPQKKTYFAAQIEELKK